MQIDCPILCITGRRLPSEDIRRVQSPPCVLSASLTLSSSHFFISVSTSLSLCFASKLTYSIDGCGQEQRHAGQVALRNLKRHAWLEYQSGSVLTHFTTQTAKQIFVRWVLMPLQCKLLCSVGFNSSSCCYITPDVHLIICRKSGLSYQKV